MTGKKATEIVLKRLVSDRTYTEELQHILRGCPTLERKAAAIESFCDQNLHCCLAGQLQAQVVPTLIAGASFMEIAARFEDECQNRHQHFLALN